MSKKKRQSIKCAGGACTNYLVSQLNSFGQGQGFRNTSLVCEANNRILDRVKDMSHSC
jgi:hypothetical protein